MICEETISSRGHCCTEHPHVSEQFINFDRAFTELGVRKEEKLGNGRVMVVDSFKCRDTVLKIYSRAEEDLCIRIMDLDPKLWRSSEAVFAFKNPDWGEKVRRNLKQNQNVDESPKKW